MLKHSKKNLIFDFLSFQISTFFMFRLFWRLCEGGASNKSHAGYKILFTHCFFAALLSRFRKIDRWLQCWDSAVEN
jgi:hypothetical protein